jgi:hypothetical protein
MARGVVQAVDCLPSKHNFMSSNPSTEKKKTKKGEKKKSFSPYSSISELRPLKFAVFSQQPEAGLITGNFKIPEHLHL